MTSAAESTDTQTGADPGAAGAGGGQSLDTIRVTTRAGLSSDVYHGGRGPNLVYFHSAGGVRADDPLLVALSDSFTVYAPVWPGYGDDETETSIEDMLDFTLHGWDLVDALSLGRRDYPGGSGDDDAAGDADHNPAGSSVDHARPVIVGHSFGGMIAAEMAAVARNDLSKLVLIAPAGLWDDDHPVPDLFAMLPFQLAEALFADPAEGEKVLTGGVDFGDNAALSAFMVSNARRLGTAGKVLFPIPNRRLSKRMHRIGVPTLLIWGTADKLYSPQPYAQHWSDNIADAQLVQIDDAGHMVTVEQTAQVARAITQFGR